VGNPHEARRLDLCIAPSPNDPWRESQPIYRQLRDRVVAMMLEGVLKQGEALPSVRQVATGCRLNPLTVLKAYQQLADEGLVEKRRGLGMYVAPAAGAGLMADERGRFLTQEWPRIQATIRRLGLSAAELLDTSRDPPARDHDDT